MPSGAKKRKAARRKKGMASAADHPLQDNERHDDLMPSDDAKECVGGSTTSSASSSPRENGCSRSAAQVLLGSGSVIMGSTAEGDKEEVLPQDDDEENTSVVIEVSSATTVVSLAESNCSSIESTKSDHGDDKSADRLVAPVDKIIAVAEEGEQSEVLPLMSLEDASSEVQIKSDRVAPEFVEETFNHVQEKASLFPDADEATEKHGESLEGHHCAAGKPELSAEPDDSIIEVAKSDQDDPKTTDELVISFAEEGRQGDGVGRGFPVQEVQVKAMSLPDADKAMEKLDVQHEDPCVASKAEILVTSEVPPSHAPPVGAQWWNCCGLLDLFARSGRDGLAPKGRLLGEGAIKSGHSIIIDGVMGRMLCY